MIDYIIKKSDYKIYIAENNNYISLNITIQKYLNKLLLERLNSVSSLEKVTKKLMGFKSKVPLFISKDLLLLCISSYRMENSFYINYFSISKYEEINGLFVVYFHSGHCCYDISSFIFHSQIKKARKLIATLNRWF
ncbi:MAG: competence protein ComK [Candidatus Izemoplasmatales bacterium]